MSKGNLLNTFFQVICHQIALMFEKYRNSSESLPKMRYKIKLRKPQEDITYPFSSAIAKI